MSKLALIFLIALSTVVGGTTGYRRVTRIEFGHREKEGVVVVRETEDGVPSFSVARYLGPVEYARRRVTLREAARVEAALTPTFSRPSRPSGGCHYRLTRSVEVNGRSVLSDTLCLSSLDARASGEIAAWYEIVETLFP